MSMPMGSDAPDAAVAARVAAAWATLLPSVLERQGALLAVKDLETGRYEHLNAAMSAFLGRGGLSALGRTDAEIFDPPLLTALRAAEQTALAQRVPLASEHRFEWAGARHDFLVWRCGGERAGGGRWLASAWIDQSAQRLREAQLRNALEQLEQQQRANEALRRELKDQGLRDADSGLFTRGHFEDQLRREVDLSTREHREFALVLIEIDPADARVAALGTPAQARILEAMGRMLRGNTRAMDASCRIDAQRFAVLLSGVGLATAHARMEGMRRQCATQIVVLDGQEIGFTVAMGVASFPHTAHTQQELLSSCEAALAEARRRGGNHVTLASIRFEGRG
jgi:diguanylate cyclase (GGDEF)-like protein